MKHLSLVELGKAVVVVGPVFGARLLAGKRLGDTDLRANYKVTVVCIKPEGHSFTYAESATVLGEHDLIVVAGHRGDIERFADKET